MIDQSGVARAVGTGQAVLRVTSQLDPAVTTALAVSVG
jgi:hypothetical protein